MRLPKFCIGDRVYDPALGLAGTVKDFTPSRVSPVEYKGKQRRFPATYTVVLDEHGPKIYRASQLKKA
jgi:hypothetical protein